MIKQSKHNINFALFIAPKIFEDSKRYVEFIKFKENLDIKNLDIAHFIAQLKQCKKITQIKQNNV